MNTTLIVSSPIELILATGAVIAALTIILKPVRGAAIFLLSIRDQWQGIQERLESLEQLKPNGGSSVADHVNALRNNQDTIMAELRELRSIVIGGNIDESSKDTPTT